MLKRKIQGLLELYLQTFRVVAIVGARQVGKSTLAMKSKGYSFVTLDDTVYFESAKRSAVDFLNGLRPPVIIDEIQRVPELFMPIKMSVDKNNKKGQFLLTGSANLLSFKQVSDSLAGRIGILRMYPLSLCESLAHDRDIVAELFAASFVGNTITTTNSIAIDFMLSGGYPESYLLDSEQKRALWYASYISSYIERDAFVLADIRKKESFVRLYNLLVSRSGGLLNKASLANEVGINANILDEYISLLEMTFQIELVKPYFSNVGKRFVKTPKQYICDCGILSHILRINKDNFTEHPYKGSLVETFIFTELRKAISVSSSNTELFHLRTSDNKEVDFVLKQNNKLVGIEVKSSSGVNIQDFKHLISLREAEGANFISGIVFYTGENIVTFGDRLYAIPICWLG